MRSNQGSSSYQHVDGLSAEQLRKSLEGIPSALQGMRSPMGDTSRSECLAGMDMLNDMFQRQARRLESQLYQRAQDQHTIEATQKQAQMAMAQVRALEEHHVQQAARITQAAKTLQTLQHKMRLLVKEHENVLHNCESLHGDVAKLREIVQSVRPEALQGLQLACDGSPAIDELRSKASELESALLETERSALQQIGATPTTAIAMSSDCNPLHDLSAVADYAAPFSSAQKAEEWQPPCRVASGV